MQRRIHDQVPGDSGPERQTMAGMEQAGMEFATYDDGTSRVQVSGEFRELERRAPGGVRMFAIWEPQGDRRMVEFDGDVPPRPWTGMVGDDGQLGAGLTAASNTLARTYALRDDGQAWEARPEPVLRLRLPRFDFNGWVSGLHEGGHARVFAAGDGQVLLVRETQAGARRVMGETFAGDYLAGPGDWYTRRRWAAVPGKVELTLYDPETGTRRMLLTFAPFSGLGASLAGFEPRLVYAYTVVTDGMVGRDDGSTSAPQPLFIASAPLPPDGEVVHTPNPHRIGPWAGFPQGVKRCPYAVCAPAVATDGSRTYLHTAAVYGRAEDAPYPEGSAVDALVCRYIAPDGSAAEAPITWGNSGGWPAAFFDAPVAVALVRAGPRSLLLVMAGALQLRPGQPWPSMTSGYMIPAYIPFAPDDAVYRTGMGARLFWSQDGGASWAQVLDASVRGLYHDFVDDSSAHSTTVTTALPVDGRVMAPDGFGGVLWMVHDRRGTVSTAAAEPYAHTFRLLRLHPEAGIEERGSFTSEQLVPWLYPEVAGLDTGVNHRTQQVTAVVAARKWVAALVRMGWYGASASELPDYGRDDTRACLAVSEDGGATWVFRALPTRDARAVATIVALGENRLGVVLLRDPRFNEYEATSTRFGVTDDALAKCRGQLYVSRDAGQTWRRDPSDGFALPYWAQLDGTYHTGLRRIENAIRDEVPPNVPQELYGPVLLRADDGRAAPLWPAAPWVADARIEEPAP